MSHLSTFLLMAHLKLVTDSSSSGLNGNTILVSIWNLVMGFIKGIVSAVVGAASNIIYAMGSAFQQILFAWASSAASYGPRNIFTACFCRPFRDVLLNNVSRSW